MDLVFDQRGKVWVTAHPSAIVPTSILSFSNEINNGNSFGKLEKISAHVKTDDKLTIPVHGYWLMDFEYKTFKCN